MKGEPSASGDKRVGGNRVSVSCIVSKRTKHASSNENRWAKLLLGGGGSGSIHYRVAEAQTQQTSNGTWRFSDLTEPRADGRVRFKVEANGNKTLVLVKKNQISRIHETRPNIQLSSCFYDNYLRNIEVSSAPVGSRCSLLDNTDRIHRSKYSASGVQQEKPAQALPEAKTKRECIRCPESSTSE